LSPIELGFSVFKKALQQAGVVLRNDAAFVGLVYRSLSKWLPRHARNSFNHCGFKLTTIEEEEHAAERKASMRKKLFILLLLTVSIP
jgi:hypothetical protein